MLLIQRTDDGRLHLRNSRQSDVARDEAEARRKLYYWGHTEISINKAFAQMREAAGESTVAASWRVLRPASPEPEAKMEGAKRSPRRRTERAGTPERQAVRPASPAAEEAPVPAPAEPAPAPRKPRARRSPRSEAAAPPPAAPEAPVAVEAPALVAKPPRRARRKATAPEGSANAGDTPLHRALALFAQGAEELRAMEAEVLPFARGPWTELREKAEYVVRCLEGKRTPGQ